MEQKGYVFTEVSLLVTHYNRSGSLQRLLKAFAELQCHFADIVVSDDGSRQEHLDKLKELQGVYNFKLITAPQNRGLGNNINKGQDAVTSTLTLYVQEDFVPRQVFPGRLQDALDCLKDLPDMDIVRFYAYFRYPYLEAFRSGFSRMLFSPMPWYATYRKFYAYSDHPHLRKSSFFEKFGRYPEGLKGDVTEYRMMMSFLKRKGKGLFYEDFKGLFDQVNSADEPSTMKRDMWRESANPLITLLRHLYRHLKFNYDFHFKTK